MSTAEAFRRTCERNALRRHAQLPLIEVRDGVAEELRRDALIAYGLAWDHYRHEFLRFRQEVLDQLRAERDPDFGMSAGGRWLIDHHAVQKFNGFLAARGFVRPAGGGVRYGAKTI